jgi:hypothetical protein
MWRKVESTSITSDIGATSINEFDHLEDKLALWHGDMPSAEQERVLKAAFK